MISAFALGVGFAMPSGYPPSPPIYWNQRLEEKSRENLWGSRSCGQNLELKGLTRGMPL